MHVNGAVTVHASNGQSAWVNNTHWVVLRFTGTFTPTGGTAQTFTKVYGHKTGFLKRTVDTCSGAQSDSERHVHLHSEGREDHPLTHPRAAAATGPRPAFLARSSSRLRFARFPGTGTDKEVRMIRLRTLVAAFAAVAAIGAGAAWAAGGGSTTTPSTTTPGTTTTPGATAPRAKHNCPNMGNSGSSSSNGAAYAPAGPMNL